MLTLAGARRLVSFLVVSVAVETALAAQTVEQDSDIPGVKTHIAYLRQHDGALYLGVAFTNAGDSAAGEKNALMFDHLTLTEPKSGQKHFPLKDAKGRFVAGPVTDWSRGGRWWMRIPAHGEVLVWAIFEPILGTTVDVAMPYSQPFDGAPVSTSTPATRAASTSTGGELQGTLTAATRADGQLKVRIKLVGTGIKMHGGGAGVYYQDAYAFDPASKRQYFLVKDGDGKFLAQPVSEDKMGGMLWLKDIVARSQGFMTLTFAAPPDSVKSVDIVVPEFDLFEAVAIAGEGGGADSGAVVAGRTIGLEQALSDLHADVTPQQVKVNLSADVLFDFDKADLKSEAAPQLAELATVLRAYPQASVMVDGHSDGKGADAYNQVLSEKRAASVAQWLVANGGINKQQLHARGWGKTKPIAPNIHPDGSDDPAGRATNRRVEITIAKSPGAENHPKSQ
jgi:outer membrane protein OmpA-like peptidoglycan-associated protein